MKEGWLDGCAILDQSLRVFAVVYSRGSPCIPQWKDHRTED